MLGDRIRELRKARHWSQIYLGDIIGVTKQSVSNWENDTVIPSIEILERLSDIFCVSTDYLLGRDSKLMLELDGLSLEQAASVQQIVIEYKKLIH